jgi:hypothetical protein
MKRDTLIPMACVDSISWPNIHYNAVTTDSNKKTLSALDVRILAGVYSYIWESNPED